AAVADHDETAPHEGGGRARPKVDLARLELCPALVGTAPARVDVAVVEREMVERVGRHHERAALIHGNAVLDALSKRKRDVCVGTLAHDSDRAALRGVPIRWSRA